MNDRFNREFDISHCQTIMNDAIIIHRNKMNNERFRDQQKFLGLYSYRENHKLTLSFGRQMGHSTFISKNANLNDVIVVYNERMKNDWVKYHSFRIITIDQIRTGRYKGLDHLCDILWFDGLYVYEKLEANECNWLCSYFQPTQVVVLGE